MDKEPAVMVGKDCILLLCPGCMAPLFAAATDEGQLVASCPGCRVYSTPADLLDALEDGSVPAVATSSFSKTPQPSSEPEDPACQEPSSSVTSETGASKAPTSAPPARKKPGGREIH